MNEHFINLRINVLINELYLLLITFSIKNIS
jgi:hypothetical protein